MPLTHLPQRIAKRLGLFPRSSRSLNAAELFPTPLLAHFSYHKCLTVYYVRIMRHLSDEFGFAYQHLNTDKDAFVSQAHDLSTKRVLSLNNRSDIDWSALPPFKATHFIRDPRDLVVSGYRYHLWTTEPWCIDPQFNWSRLTRHPLFAYVEAATEKYPQAISYQSYLNGLDLERGLLLEMLWREPHLQHMQRWDRHNPNILEMRYEDIIGNETDAFRRAFDHYAFHPRVKERGVELANQFSLKNQPKKERGHIRKGTHEQWRKEFTPALKTLFKQEWNTLLLQLGYERDAEW